MKKWCSYALLLLACAFSMPVSAAEPKLQITEFMYDVPGANSGRQWIEVHNTSQESLRMTDKSLRVVDASGAHLIRTDANSGSNDLLYANNVAVIAENPEKFLTDHIGFTGQLFKSAFSLTASGTIAIARSGDTINSVTYSSKQGGKGDGNSLQRSGTMFIAGAPTPGVIPHVIPPKIVAKVKPAVITPSSSKGRKKSTSNRTTKYDKGITDPAATADAATAGSLSLPSLEIPPEIQFLLPIIATASFKWFLALLAISGFSLIVLLRHGSKTLTS